MAEVGYDVLEQLLIGLDVKDLIRCKSVCKSWYSLITSSGFISRHLNHSHSKDQCNNDIGIRRIFLDRGDDVLVGSSNGLVCIKSSKLLVGNPMTREVRQLEHPTCMGSSVCWGFGYDSCNDDYKVILGVWKYAYKTTCVQVFSLKSNEWRVVGEVSYEFATKVGMLCSGTLYWIVRDNENKKLIMSYDLSKEEFKEIPEPNDKRYECWVYRYDFIIHLGIMKESLCIYVYNFFPLLIWTMKKYDREQSREWLGRGPEINFYIVHSLKSPYEESLFHADSSHRALDRDFIRSPVFVQSLVSPHVNERPKYATNNKKSAKSLVSPSVNKRPVQSSNDERIAKRLIKGSPATDSNA